jgi:uncharacterized membrane protein
MSARIPTARHVNFGCILLLAGLVLGWHVIGLWPGGSSWASWLLGIPLVAVAGMHVARHRNAAFWAGVVALFTFCHGVMEAWASEAGRIPAVVEGALSVAVVLSAGWDGLRARTRRRRAPPAV